MKKEYQNKLCLRDGEKRNGERPWERGTDEVAGDLKIMGIRNGNALARDGKQYMRTVLDATVHSAQPKELSRKLKFH